MVIRDKVLKQVLELKDELLTFNTFLANDIWCTKISYLAHIVVFNGLNTMSTSIQSKNENILTSTSKLSTYQKKISL